MKVVAPYVAMLVALVLAALSFHLRRAFPTRDEINLQRMNDEKHRMLIDERIEEKIDELVKKFVEHGNVVSAYSGKVANLEIGIAEIKGMVAANANKDQTLVNIEQLLRALASKEVK